MKIKTAFNLLDVSTSDPDDARRRRLLNIILIGLTTIALAGAIILGIAIIVGVLSISEFRDVLLAVTVFVIGATVILAINRYWSGLIASSAFLLFFTVLLSVTDTPEEVTAGRSVFYFVIPIIMASVLLRSYASFIMAALSGLIIIVLALSINLSPDPTPMFGFFAAALVSWLSSRSLEQTLSELRVTNRELDQRVADRTHELSQSLAREHAEGSRRQAILEGIGDGVIVLNNDNEIIMANPAISRLLEIPVEQIANHKFDDLLESPVLSNEDRNTLIQVVNTTDTSMAPMRIRWDKKTLSVNASPVIDLNGGTIGNVAVLRDFTREAEVEEMKNTFVAMVSHELRTPLNAILGYSEMMRDAVYGPVNKKQANAADRILKNSRRLFDIVNDLLDKAQIEAGHLALHYEEFKTIELVENLHSVMDKIANDKGLELSAVVAPEMPDMLKGDPQRLQQVMVNLANNAVKFTDKGGIYIRIYRVTDEHWAFDVTDTGPGIALEDQKYIFDPFRQVDGTITRSHGGIGLGLAIVKRIVDLMGGRIFVQSSLGHGTMFTVVLPLAPVEKEE
jgi:PAS domain S-box-containing protein